MLWMSHMLRTYTVGQKRVPRDTWSRIEDNLDDRYDSSGAGCDDVEHDYRNGGMTYVLAAERDGEAESVLASS